MRYARFFRDHKQNRFALPDAALGTAPGSVRCYASRRGRFCGLLTLFKRTFDAARAAHNLDQLAGHQLVIIQVAKRLILKLLQRYDGRCTGNDSGASKSVRSMLDHLFVERVNLIPKRIGAIYRLVCIKLVTNGPERVQPLFGFFVRERPQIRWVVANTPYRLLGRDFGRATGSFACFPTPI